MEEGKVMKRSGTLFKRGGTYNLRYIIEGCCFQVSLKTKDKEKAEAAREVFMRDRCAGLDKYLAFLKAEIGRIEKFMGDNAIEEKPKKKPVKMVESFLPVTFKQSRDLTAVAKQHREPEMYGLFLVMAYTGLRLVDAATLKVDEIHFDRNVIVRVPMKTRRHVKNRNTGRALIGLHRALYLDLFPFINNRDSGFLFPEIASWSAERRSDNVQAVFKKAGVVKVIEKDSGRKQSLYGSSSFRHALSDALRAAEVPQVVINAILCHSDGTMASTYASVKDEEVIEAIQKALPDLR